MKVLEQEPINCTNFYVPKLTSKVLITFGYCTKLNEKCIVLKNKKCNNKKER